MRHITRPPIPDSPPDVEFHDEKRGDVREYLSDCYEYLDQNDIQHGEYGFDEDEEGKDRAQWSLDRHINEIERQIKEIEDEEKVNVLPDNIVRQILFKIETEKRSTQNKIDCLKGKVELLSQILNKHTDDIAKLRKEND